MARMTSEQRREQAAAERRTQKIAEFRKRIETERAKRIYSDRAAFDASASDDRGAMALYELVHEHQRTTENLRLLVRRMAERMADANKRMDDGERAFWHSTALGDLPSDIEQASTKRDTLASAAIASLAWATGWYAPQIYSRRANDARALLLSLDVAMFSRTGSDISGWAVRSTQEDGVKFFLTVVDGAPSLSVRHEDAQVYETEEAAWLAAMALCGERE
jgi:hypothetical protein